MSEGRSNPIGMIVPPTAGQVPPEAPAVYPDALFLAKGLGLREMSPDDYARVTGMIGDAAEALAAEGAAVVGVMGTSLSFYRGAAFNDEIVDVVAERSGRPASTMSWAIVKALRAFAATRLAVLTAYEDDVNELLRTFLVEHRLSVELLRSLRIRAVEAVAGVTTEMLVKQGLEALHAAEAPEALLISCGGLQTIDAVRRLEDETGLPVVTSATAGVWDLARLAGHHRPVEGFGRLFGIA